VKITDVRTAIVIVANYAWTFVRVYTDEGISGLGKSFPALDLPQGGIGHGF
jgi:L-alanine-DL-glutamate epimerase-like enolase superfamily enzyme